jgi:Putative collagen-binding domain of a collagenase
MSKLAGTTSAHWYDPTTAKYVNLDGSPFVNSGSRRFTPPGKNGDVAADWVLVLEANYYSVPPLDTLG